MKILSIDPGFGRVGIAVLEKENRIERVLFSECFEPRTELFEDRLVLIGKRIDALVQKHKPNALAIENLFLATNKKTAMRVSEARGVMLYCARKAGLSVFEYTPLQIKVALTGYGKATKEQVAFMVERIIKRKTKSMIDDEVDAIAVGLTHLACVRT